MLLQEFRTDFVPSVSTSGMLFRVLVPLGLVGAGQPSCPCRSLHDYLFSWSAFEILRHRFSAVRLCCAWGRYSLHTVAELSESTDLCFPTLGSFQPLLLKNSFSVSLSLPLSFGDYDLRTCGVFTMVFLISWRLSPLIFWISVLSVLHRNTWSSSIFKSRLAPLSCCQYVLG